MNHLRALQDGSSLESALKKQQDSEPSTPRVLPAGSVPPKRAPLIDPTNNNKEIPPEIVGILLEAISDTSDTFFKLSSMNHR
jgi:hypothetical protein